MSGPLILDDCDLFDISKFSFTDSVKGENNEQLTYFAQYNYGNHTSQVIFKTDPIKITKYGIPPIGHYIKQDKDRNYILIPHDPSQSSCNKLFNMLAKLDEFMVNPETKKKLFGNKADKFKYVPLIKTPQDPDYEDEDEDIYKKKTMHNKITKLNYCKVKFLNDYVTKNLTTSVFKKAYNGDAKLIENIKTVTDLNNYLYWGSVARFAIIVTRIWANKIAHPGSVRKEYGITLKCLQIEVAEPVPVYNNKYFEKNYIFGPDKKNNDDKYDYNKVLEI